MQAVLEGDGGIGDDVAVKGVLHGDLAAVVLAEQTADDGAGLLAQGVAGDVVGDAEEDERVEDGLELGRLRRDERVDGLGRHGDGVDGLV